MTVAKTRPGAGQHAQILEIARWPEWGVERWEETDLIDEISPPVPTDRDEEERAADGTQWEETNQTEAPSPPIPAESGKGQPGNNVAKIRGGIFVGLLLLGGGFSSYQISSARALDLQPVPVDPPRSISLDLPALAMPAVVPDPGIAAAQASPVPPLTATGSGRKSRPPQVSALRNPIKARAIPSESRCDRAVIQRQGDGESPDLVRAEWAEWRRCEERRIHPRP
jgi:hypothetical protein